MSEHITQPTAARPDLRWRVVDIAVASAIGVASSLIYWIVALASSAPWAALEGLVPGLAGLINGLWLFAGPLAALIVRKPGAALYAEVVAAVLESLFGNQWGGVDTVLIGVVQGLGAEVVFLALLYTSWGTIAATLSGALSGLASWGYSFLTHLQSIDIAGSYGIVYALTSVCSGALFAGILMRWLYVAIARTGALDAFAAGREVRGLAD